jgi:hypothetical protein
LTLRKKYFIIKLSSFQKGGESEDSRWVGVRGNRDL